MPHDITSTSTNFNLYVNTEVFLAASKLGSRRHIACEHYFIARSRVTQLVRAPDQHLGDYMACNFCMIHICILLTLLLCYFHKNVITKLLSTHADYTVWIVVGVGIGVLLLLLIGIGIFVVCKMKKVKWTKVAITMVPIM